MQTTTKSSKPPTLFRLSLYYAPNAPSQEFLSATSSTTDLTIYLAKDSSELRAYYDQRIFSSARISTILTQLAEIVKNASLNPQESVGRISFITKAQSDLLPDPTCDLDWSGFRGGIHDIFSANALKHPGRLCVAETASSSSPRREFTYQQINEASNILGHHFVKSGIQLGDVIMVYAHRGVDLVVAVMGVLKAGATFSVIDPQYPPDRQNIYLDVARPRALVVIEKATQEAGELTETVRSFIKENLDLRTTVPSLRIHDDGTLTGGDIDGKDVLENCVSLKAKSTGVIVGPDSTPTLSFTSGSEGRPKGVRGRHFSLAYYFPWMSKEFNLTENDRFTMLSGIAHDPIQRDIFTPLFLGAQLLVPSKEDIQNEKLAEWMREHGATVTHLTPAMGQILVGEAVAQFPALHHAFFVGDVLIKRDCRLLRELAPNVDVVNMYGTTETQRAVSYFCVPSVAKDSTYLNSMKDVIPAGKGMMNVQLLVVNRFDRTKICGVGEIGEIYVRAGGLAEGYLGLPDLTKTKFISNWFVDPAKWVKEDRKKLESESAVAPWREFYQGPRDRLYRSGDLGRYTPHGDVECSGRADDQVKIRGFRIELGEIDTHLSRHPLVRENVTLVRRDKDEEPALVSYFVPVTGSRWQNWLSERGLQEQVGEGDMIGMLRQFKPLRDDAREYLRTKLPAYAVPTVFVPMKRLPLNPNGKIDKPALPFPDTAQLSAAAPRRPSASFSSMSETQKMLAEIWAKLLPNITTKMIGSDDSFFDLGGHSILAQQMFFALKKRWSGTEINMNAVFRSPTLKGLAGEIDKARDRDSFIITGDAETRPTTADAEDDYAGDAKMLAEKLPKSFPAYDRVIEPSKEVTVFVTGATGFLGSYIVRDLLSRQNPSVKVIAHVRAKSAEAGAERVRNTCQAYGVWDPSWSSRIECVTGNLGDPKLGLAEGVWEKVAQEVDIVIHNGAWVHWVYPYSNLKPSNVLGTIDILQLCATGKAKQLAYVSSTSVLDTDHYVELSDAVTRQGGAGVPESDDLMGSAKGLGTGYGQSKWVGEYLVKESGARGLKGAIIRPGYVTGDSKTGGKISIFT
jgi:L-2-aminoadipate reductase